ncbi:hypothetical protein PRIPAC_88263 [Pristionchus pacificus]|nr:hypothetical protein PRIPAC_88263 [Pristionchus pacificus]
MDTEEHHGDQGRGETETPPTADAPRVADDVLRGDVQDEAKRGGGDCGRHAAAGTERPDPRHGHGGGPSCDHSDAVLSRVRPRLRPPRSVPRPHQQRGPLVLEGERLDAALRRVGRGRGADGQPGTGEGVHEPGAGGHSRGGRAGEGKGEGGEGGGRGSGAHERGAGREASGGSGSGREECDRGKEGGSGGNEGGEGEGDAEKEKLIGAILSSLAPKDIVGYRLRQRPCAECAAIWNEYGALIRTTTKAMAHEFAFRCHPIHPCVALLNVTMECFRTSLVEGDDEAYRIPSAHTIKVPSREQLKELTNDLELEVSVPLSLGDRHAYACTENYQVAMHFRADAMRKAYERFMDACYKRDEEGKPFCCEVCWVLLPSLRHFKVHMLSDAHDKKMGKAPVRQSALYNPLGQMVCFIDAVTLLARKKAKKIEKKEERKEERKQREKRKEEQVQKPAPVVVKKEQEVDKDEKKKAKEEGQKPAPVVVKKEPEVDKEEKGKKEEREKGKERISSLPWRDRW